MKRRSFLKSLVVAISFPLGGLPRGVQHLNSSVFMDARSHLTEWFLQGLEEDMVTVFSNIN